MGVVRHYRYYNIIIVKQQTCCSTGSQTTSARPSGESTRRDFRVRKQRCYLYTAQAYIIIQCLPHGEHKALFADGRRQIHAKQIKNTVMAKCSWHI